MHYNVIDAFGGKNFLAKILLYTVFHHAFHVIPITVPKFLTWGYWLDEMEVIFVFNKNAHEKQKNFPFRESNPGHLGESQES